MPIKTDDERAAQVAAAVEQLPSALDAALQADDRTKVLRWVAVEQLGATVHRQARLLAGKTKGG